jgi:hypothetical protein
MAKSVPASSLEANDSTLASGAVVGEIRVLNNKTYRYFKVKDLAVAAGNVVEYSTTEGAVTKDRAGGTSVARIAAGVAAGTVSAGNYGWFQVDGEVEVTVPANVAITAGTLLTPHISSDGAVAAVATTLTRRFVFAVALGADTATTSVAGTVRAALIRV